MSPHDFGSGLRMSAEAGDKSFFVFRVEDLCIDTTGSSSVPDDMDDEQWLRLILAFRSAQDLHVAGELATDIFILCVQQMRGTTP